ncbi:hypothetical protein [Sorangium sp. So ce145]|uniref:hypothetical protein n=1 Tax=Sorangium sp. So ce145 TaxID=3133285 RepID=UPI003F600D93
MRDLESLGGERGRRPVAYDRADGLLPGEGQRRVREAGFDVHFVKPIDPASLQSHLASVAGDAGVTATTALA